MLELNQHAKSEDWYFVFLST